MKRAILLCIAIVVSLVAVTSTLAYFTDQVQADGIVASGNINIFQHEYEHAKDADGNKLDTLQPYTQSQLLYPGSDIDKIVTVENAGKNNAYVRTFIAVPSYYDANGNSISWLSLNKNAAAPEWIWADTPITNVTIDGEVYDIYYATNKEILAPGATTEASLLGYHISEQVGYKDGSYVFNLPDGTAVPLSSERDFKILVATEATQAIVFENAEDAMDTTYGSVPNANRHPWKKVVFAATQSDLDAALQNAAYDTQISLAKGSYTLPAKLPNGIRIEASEPDVILALADELSAYDVKIDGVTIENKMVFHGHGSFQEVTFQQGWSASQLTGDLQFDYCVYDTAQYDAGQYTVSQTECTKLDGTAIQP